MRRAMQGILPPEILRYANKTDAVRTDHFLAVSREALSCIGRQLEALGGVYCENCNIAEPVPATSEEMRGVRPWAMDPALAERLWALSEKITGLTLH